MRFRHAGTFSLPKKLFANWFDPVGRKILRGDHAIYSFDDIVRFEVRPAYKTHYLYMVLEVDGGETRIEITKFRKELLQEIVSMMGMRVVNEENRSGGLSRIIDFYVR